MCKVLSRDALKIIAVLAMLIDHVGKLFFPEVLFLQILGRLAFPIFAFFIAEGFYYTKNKLKYFLTMLIFAVLAQIPYLFLFSGLNVLFTFCCSLILLSTWDIASKFSRVEKIILRLIFVIVAVLLCCFALLLQMDYQWYGILLPFAFYVFRNHKLIKFAMFVLMTVLFVFQNLGWGAETLTINNSLQLFAVMSILLLAFYDDKKKSNKKIKYLFYIFYPLHLVVLFLLTLI